MRHLLSTFIILVIGRPALGSTDTKPEKRHLKEGVMVFSPADAKGRPAYIAQPKSGEITKAPILFTKIGRGTKADEKSAVERDAPVDVKVEGKDMNVKSSSTPDGKEPFPSDKASPVDLAPPKGDSPAAPASKGDGEKAESPTPNNGSVDPRKLLEDPDDGAPAPVSPPKVAPPPPEAKSEKVVAPAAAPKRPDLNNSAPAPTTGSAKVPSVDQKPAESAAPTIDQRQEDR